MIALLLLLKVFLSGLVENHVELNFRNLIIMIAFLCFYFFGNFSKSSFDRIMASELLSLEDMYSKLG